MDNKMRRACVIPSVNDGKLFDIANGITAYAAASSYYYMAPACVDVAFMGEPSGDWEDSKAITLPPSAILQLAQALNPLIEVTQAVLDAMVKEPEAKFLVLDNYDNLVDCRYNSKWRVMEVDGVYLPVGAWMYTKVEEYSPSFDKKRLAVGDYIQADCPLALQVLLQFNTEGELFDVSN